MHHRRLAARVAFLVGALAAALAVTPVSPASAAHSPGPTAGAIVLESDAQFTGYDVAIDGAGTAYVGWISYTTAVLRRVHVCVLPPGAAACAGGVKTILPLGGPSGESSANGLQVVTGPGVGATLVWHHDTADSITLPFGGQRRPRWPARMARSRRPRTARPHPVRVPEDRLSCP